MGNQLKIDHLEVHQFQWEHENLGSDYNGFNWVYEPGSKITQTDYMLQIFTDQGIGTEIVRK